MGDHGGPWKQAEALQCDVFYMLSNSSRNDVSAARSIDPTPLLLPPLPPLLLSPRCAGCMPPPQTLLLRDLQPALTLLAAVSSLGIGMVVVAWHEQTRLGPECIPALLQRPTHAAIPSCLLQAARDAGCGSASVRSWRCPPAAAASQAPAPPARASAGRRQMGAAKLAA